MEYNVCVYPENIPSTSIDLDVLDMPDNLDVFEGVGINKGFQHISHTYLNGLINYTKPVKAFLTFEYNYDNKEDTLKRLSEMTSHDWFHTNLGILEDSVVVIGELDNSYVVFIYDCDVSECCIYRISNEHSFNDVCNFTLDTMKYRQDWENPSCHEYVELPLPTGWIKF